MKDATATQAFVPLEEIRDGIVLLKDGSMRAILLASSVNFALKSSEEQQAILSQFQNFLNTLDFSMQLYVQSRKLNIEPYLALLREREEGQRNDLMKTQLREYIQFVRAFTHDVDIMTKSFFVVISYSPAILDIKKGISNLFTGAMGSKKQSMGADIFEENRSQLEQRIAVVEHGLSAMGIRTVTLGTSEVIDLFYHIFNPNEGDRELPH